MGGNFVKSHKQKYPCSAKHNSSNDDMVGSSSSCASHFSCFRYVGDLLRRGVAKGSTRCWHLPRPSNVVPFWVVYYNPLPKNHNNPKKELHWSP